MAYSKVKLSYDGDVALVSMADPAMLNALTAQMSDEITEATATAANQARCIVLTGEGRGFCSGANVAGGAPPIGEDGVVDIGLLLEKHFHPLVTHLRDLPVPFITSVNGAAAGMGCSIALMGDLIVAAESAYFLQAFRRIGLAPDGGASYLLPRALTRAQAMEMMLLGEKLPARKALEWGLINRCVPDSELMTATLTLAGELARGPTKALAMTRKLAWDGFDADFSSHLHAERMAQREAGRTADFIEGVSAFAQKRPAAFKGN